jgi:hypothetical protein
MFRFSFFVIFLFLFSANGFAQGPERWESVMQEFEQLDREERYPPESIFFTGSSSIRLWDTLAEDMAPYPVIERGFGGSRMPDLLYHADRFIGVHDFQALVLFVANDITGNPDEDRTPGEVRDLFEKFFLQIREYQPDAPIFVIEITPTNSRWDAWPQIREANGLIAQLCDEYEKVIFIPTADLFLDQSRVPKPDLFVSDQLHLNEAGYAVWAKRVRSYLDPVLER